MGTQSNTGEREAEAAGHASDVAQKRRAKVCASDAVAREGETTLAARELSKTRSAGFTMLPTVRAVKRV